MNKYVIKLISEPIEIKWWGQKWIENIAQYADIYNRVERGRAYLHRGAIRDLRIEKGRVEASVLGTGNILYDVSINIKPVSKEKEKYFSNTSNILKEMFLGNISQDEEFVFSMSEKGLFPNLDEIEFFCSCLDVANGCKHVMAVLYALGYILDRDPTMLFSLRGIDVEEYWKEFLLNEGNWLLSHSKNDGANRIDYKDVSSVFGIDIECRKELKEEKEPIKINSCKAKEGHIQEINVWDGSLRKILPKRIQENKGLDIKDGVLKGYYGEDECVEIPSCVKTIGKRVFCCKDDLIAVKIHEGVTNIEASAFEGCLSLESLWIPSSLRTIAESSFYSCKKLTNIYYDGDVKDWLGVRNKRCFHNKQLFIKGCPVWKVENFVLPEINEIEDYAFVWWKGVINVEIPQCVEKMGEGIFYGCENLQKVVVKCKINSKEQKLSKIISTENFNLVYDLRQNPVYILPHLRARLLSLSCFVKNLKEGIYYDNSVIEENNRFIKNNKITPKYALRDSNLMQYLIENGMISKDIAIKLLPIAEEEGFNETKDMLLHFIE